MAEAASGAGQRARPGSHAGSHSDKQLQGNPDSPGQRTGRRPRPRTDTNERGHQLGYLRMFP